VENSIRIRDIAQAVLALIVTIGVLVLIVLGHTIPEGLWFALGSALGFFFGGATVSNGRDGMTVALSRVQANLPPPPTPTG
jgi:hypothetical protein